MVVYAQSTSTITPRKAVVMLVTLSKRMKKMQINDVCLITIEP